MKPFRFIQTLSVGFGLPVQFLLFLFELAGTLVAHRTDCGSRLHSSHPATEKACLPNFDLERER